MRFFFHLVFRKQKADNLTNKMIYLWKRIDACANQDWSLHIWHLETYKNRITKSYELQKIPSCKWNLGLMIIKPSFLL